MKIYFTKRHKANDTETAQAKRFGARLVNGMFGDTFNKECSVVFGNVPDHLAHLKPKPKKKVVVKTENSE